jgi:uracil DNA glycosylase
MHFSWKLVLKSYLDDYDVNVELDQISECPEYTFNAFRDPFDLTKIVLLHPSPYSPKHTNTGHALEVRTRGRERKPKIIQNLETYFKKPYPGNLKQWREQGILLLNDYLIRDPKLKLNVLTGPVIQEINRRLEGVVFILVGGETAKYESLIDSDRHLVLKSKTFQKYNLANWDVFPQAEEYIRARHNLIINFTF